MARFASQLMVALAACSIASGAVAQDRSVERNARRQQLQLMALQQQLQDAQGAKAKVDAEKVELAKQLAAATARADAADAAAKQTAGRLKSEEGSRADLASQVAALEKKLADQQHAGETLAADKDQALATLTRTRDDERKKSSTLADAQAQQIGDCTKRNERLVALGAELLDRYRTKGVADALKQADPVLGLRDVEMFNVVQEYRDRLDAERYSAVAPRKP